MCNLVLQTLLISLPTTLWVKRTQVEENKLNKKNRSDVWPFKFVNTYWICIHIDCWRSSFKNLLLVITPPCKLVLKLKCAPIEPHNCCFDRPEVGKGSEFHFGPNHEEEAHMLGSLTFRAIFYRNKVCWTELKKSYFFIDKVIESFRSSRNFRVLR